MPVSLTRRTFVKATAATGAAAYLTWKFGVPGILDAEAAPGDLAAPQERLVPSVCAQCPGQCGILVRVVDGARRLVTASGAILPAGCVGDCDDQAPPPPAQVGSVAALDVQTGARHPVDAAFDPTDVG